MSINLTTTLLSGQLRSAEKQLPETQQPQQSSVSLAVKVDVAFGIDPKPLTLAYQAAIDRINEAVAPYLGEGAIARGYDEGLDVSPEATADRIVSRSTALFSRYAAQRPDDDAQSRINNFVDIIRSGIEQGFSEARDILSSLGVLKDEIEFNVNRTFELTLAGLDEFQTRSLSEDPE